MKHKYDTLFKLLDAQRLAAKATVEEAQRLALRGTLTKMQDILYQTVRIQMDVLTKIEAAEIGAELDQQTTAPPKLTVGPDYKGPNVVMQSFPVPALRTLPEDEAPLVCECDTRNLADGPCEKCSIEIEQPEVEECKFCGFTLLDPCESPPAAYCEKAITEMHKPTPPTEGENDVHPKAQ